MNKEYIQALSLAESALRDVNKIYDKEAYESFEDAKAYQAMESLINHLESFIGDIKHYSRDTTEGYLSINNNDRYSINDNELTCGYPIEVYNSEYDQWEAGRIEHSSKYGGYYFYNYDGSEVPLFDGMKARLRI